MKKIIELIKNERRFLLWIFIFGFVIRLGVVIFLGNTHNPEMWEHGQIARNLYTGHGFTMHWPYSSEISEKIEIQKVPPNYQGAFLPPLSPYLIYWSFLIFGDNSNAYIALMILNSILGALLAVFVYKTAKLLFDERAAALSAIGAAIFMPAAYSVITFSGSPIFHLLAAIVIFLAVKTYQRFSVKNFFLLSLFAGLMPNIRSEFLPIGFVFIILVIFKAFKDKQIIGKNILGYIIGSFLVFVSLGNFWAVRNYIVFGKNIGTVSHPYHEMWRGNNIYATGGYNTKDGKNIWINKNDFPELFNKIDAVPIDQKMEVSIDSLFKEELVSYAKANPLRTLELACKRVFFLWSFDPYTPRSHDPIFVLFLFLFLIPFYFGFASKIKKLFKKKEFLFALLISLFYIAYSGVIFITHFEDRYQIYVVSGTLPFWGYGLMRIYNLISKKEREPKTLENE